MKGDSTKKLLSTREVAAFLNVNEKMVYSLVSEKNLPATKITGKWLFPRHLVEQWIEANTANFPEPAEKLPPYHGLLILAGSNDLLLDKTISLYNTQNPEHVAVAPSGRFIYITNSSTITLFERAATSNLEYRAVFSRSQLGGANSIRSIAISPDGTKLLIGAQKGIYLFTVNQTTGDLAVLDDSLSDQTWNSRHVRFSADGLSLFVAAYNYYGLMGQFENPMVVYKLDEHTGKMYWRDYYSDLAGQMAVASDGINVYVTDQNNVSVRTGNYPFTKYQTGIDGIQGRVVAISPDGKHVYVASDQRIDMYDRMLQ